MTEVPEHLLRRSRERKAALSGEAPPAESGSGAAGAAGGGEGGGTGGAVEPAASAAPARAAAAPAPPTFTGPPQPPPRRQRVPVWAMPVLVALPFWALLYTGSFGDRPTKGGEATPVEVGQGVFRSAGCSTCHGATGGGGIGPPLANVVKTFPAFADHVAWVTNGSAAVKGQTYGNSGRVATGGMPGFGSQLSKAEIVAVVCHERVDYGKQSPVPPECQAGAEAGDDVAGGGTAGKAGDQSGGGDTDQTSAGNNAGATTTTSPSGG